jgi:hypothetical protein
VNCDKLSAIFPLFYNVFTVNRKLKLHVKTSETVNMLKKLVVDCFKYAGNQKHNIKIKYLTLTRSFDYLDPRQTKISELNYNKQQ